MISLGFLGRFSTDELANEADGPFWQLFAAVFCMVMWGDGPRPIYHRAGKPQPGNISGKRVFGFLRRSGGCLFSSGQIYRRTYTSFSIPYKIPPAGPDPVDFVS